MSRLCLPPLKRDTLEPTTPMGTVPGTSAQESSKKEHLLVAGSIIWSRVTSTQHRESERTNPAGPMLTQLDEQHTLLSIPSFLVDFQTFKSFLKEHQEELKNTTTLIIDIRGNRGGNAIYFPLIELYATQNMQGGQGHVLSSEDNLAYFQRQEKYSSKVYKPVVERIQSHMREIVDGPLYPGESSKSPKTTSST